MDKLKETIDTIEEHIDAMGKSSENPSEKTSGKATATATATATVDAIQRPIGDELIILMSAIQECRASLKKQEVMNANIAYEIQRLAALLETLQDMLHSAILETRGNGNR